MAMYICFLFITFRALFGFGSSKPHWFRNFPQAMTILVESCSKVVSEISEGKPLSSKSLWKHQSVRGRLTKLIHPKIIKKRIFRQNSGDRAEEGTCGVLYQKLHCPRLHFLTFGYIFPHCNQGSSGQKLHKCKYEGCTGHFTDLR